MNLYQQYQRLQRFARKHGCSVRVSQDNFGNVEFGAFDGKFHRADEPFCVCGVDGENDFGWVDAIKRGIEDYRSEHPMAV